MTANITITGGNDLYKRMNAVPDKLMKGVIRSSLRQGSNLIRDQAKSNFNAGGGPSDLSGALQASIRSTSRRGTVDRVTFSVVAGTLTTAQTKKFGPESAYYALWVERGHINRKLHDALTGTRRFKVHQRMVSESNTPAHPYMAPALQQKGQEAIDLVISNISSGLPGALS